MGFTATLEGIGAKAKLGNYSKNCVRLLGARAISVFDIPMPEQKNSAEVQETTETALTEEFISSVCVNDAKERSLDPRVSPDGVVKYDAVFVRYPRSYQEYLFCDLKCAKEFSDYLDRVAAEWGPDLEKHLVNRQIQLLQIRHFSDCETCRSSILSSNLAEVVKYLPQHE